MTESSAAMRGPDFFIIGAPKCGTTALANYLGQHPEVGMCARKETHYFAPDLRDRLAQRRRRGPARTLDEYLGFFEGAKEKRRLGEASVWYLYSSGAPHEIHAYREDAQIIVMLRNPVEMLHALHAEFVQQEIEPVNDFEAALGLDVERERQGTPRGFAPTSYRAAVRYAEQLKRYVDAFGRERVHVVLYEDFRRDTLREFHRTCRFLGVSPDVVPEMPVINANRVSRSRRLQRLLKTPPEPLRPLLHAVVPMEVRRRVGTRLKIWNSRYEARAPLTAGVARLLRGDVEREVTMLRQVAGLDASRWLGDATGAASQDVGVGSADL